MLSDKIKILTLSDHPLSPSGVGTQTNYMINSLLETGKYRFISMGGAIKHDNYQPIKTEKWKDDWIIFPIDGYGTEDVIRSIIRTHKPDILWFMTDPRFYEWLWAIENEIRPNVLMVYYHVWDNYPYPSFNKKYYDSNDAIVSISKLTYDVVNNVAPEVENHYLPHAVNPDIFKRLPDPVIRNFRNESFKEEEKEQNPDRFMFFWNNRNARRKQSGSLIWWFKEFLDEVGHDKAFLMMHTDPKDPNGQDLPAIMEELELDKGQVMISNQKISPEELSMLYNMADCTINISDAEGFGLATLESLSCETPIIATMTGGLQEQVTDGENWFGVGLEPASKSVIGSLQVPFIYEDRLSKDDFVAALLKVYNLSKEERAEIGKMGRDHVMKNYNFKDFGKKWDEVLSNLHKKYGSWENRKEYNSWELIEV